MTAPVRTIEMNEDGIQHFGHPDGAIVVVIQRDDRLEVHCHGALDHYREDGSCEHTEEMLAVQKRPDQMYALPWCGCSSREELEAHTARGAQS
jgi:hypothetical protein